MKKITVALAGMLLSIACFSNEINSKYVSQSGSLLFRDTVTASSIPAPANLLLDIIKATGLQQNFELKAADVLNIEASIQHKKRVILYNPEFINKLNEVTKNKWAVAALLAHEVGHHLNGHTIKKSGSTIELELEADQFAGFILQKMGASLKDAQQVMYYIGSKENSKTHPGRSSRLKAIQTGWEQAYTS
jgi:hypothetical protein